MKLQEIENLDCLKCLQGLCIPMCAYLGGGGVGRGAGLGRGYMCVSIVFLDLGICTRVFMKCLG